MAFEGLKKAAGWGLAGTAVAAMVVAGFKTEEEPLQPDQGETPIAVWHGRPYLPPPVNELITDRLPDRYKNDGTADMRFYHDPEEGNYGVLTFTLHGDRSASATVTCRPTDPESLDVAFPWPKSQILGRAIVDHAVWQGDMAERLCEGGEMSGRQIRDFASSGEQAPSAG